MGHGEALARITGDGCQEKMRIARLQLSRRFHSNGQACKPACSSGCLQIELVWKIVKLKPILEALRDSCAAGAPRARGSSCPASAPVGFRAAQPCPCAAWQVLKTEMPSDECWTREECLTLRLSRSKSHRSEALANGQGSQAVKLYADARDLWSAATSRDSE